MYRKRARAAHNIPAQQLPQPQHGPAEPSPHQQPAEGWNYQQPTVQFFNPVHHQNGDTQQPPAPVPASLANSDPGVSTVNGSAGAGADPAVSGGSEWNNYNHNNPVGDPAGSQNNNSEPYNYNYNTGQDYGQHEESAGPAVQQTEQFQPELTLDPSGHWYWDYQHQQWFPYYQQHNQSEQFDYDNHQATQENDVVEQLAENLQQLSTCSPTVGDHQDQHQDLLQPASLPASPVEVVEVVEAEAGLSDNSLLQNPEELEVAGAGALGPPDLVDHRPNSSQPELVSSLAGQQQQQQQQYQPPDLTFQPVASLGSNLGFQPVSHDQHYEFYSQAYTASQPGPAQGMPDVTGQPLGAVGGEEEAPDILRTEPAVGGPANPAHSVPSSDRNLYMETGELAEEDVVRAQDLGGHSSLPPMVGGNEQSGPLQRLVLGDSLGLGLAREVEGESQPPPAQLPREPTEGESQPVPSAGPVPPPGAARVVPGLSVATQPSPPAPPPDLPPSLGEARSEAAGSDRRDVTVMGPTVSRAPPPPTPGRDIAGEESAAGPGAGPGYRQRDFESTDERDPDSDSGDRYDNTRRRGASPRRVTDRSYRSSTDREEDRRYRNRREEERRFRRDDERKQRQERDSRSYYDARRRAEEEEEDRRSHRGNSSRYERYSGRDYEESRRREDSDEDDRRSHRGVNSSRYGVKREPRLDYDERSVRGYEEDRNSHRHSRPSSRAGSISYNPDSSMRGTMDMSNMSNMSMVFMQQHQAMLQEAMRQQMLALNPLGIQIQSAVAEMEKALESPANVLIYKQHWDHYNKSPALMEKLRAEQPIQHHLIQHFRNNFWHLVVKREPEQPLVPSVPSPSQTRPEQQQADSFSTEFHGGTQGDAGAEELSSILGTSSAPTPSPVPPSAPPDRLTPLMFSRPHVCARMASGVLVKLEPNNPQEGQTASVEVHSIEALLRNTVDSQELVAFPGPLKPGVTHKNDVIKFCEKKIAAAGARRDIADKESYVLLWEMLVLLLRQKGQVEGSDLAELLLRGTDGELEQGESCASSLNNEEILESSVVTSRTSGNTGGDVNKFRSYLLHGNKTEGLEYAMSVGLWGHALFLASKMDQRTYASVMTRFANGLVINDPLQTLYQLMSSRVPGAMKQCGDRRWGDWRPHLAMILSNTLPGTDINRRSIITLGDTLLAKGQLYAAQFCYIVSAADWGSFSNKTAKLVLLLSSPTDRSLEQFASIEAIQCTEIYEFVQKLGNKDYSMPFLQPYKYLQLTRLLEAGLTTRAQDYTRVLAQYVINTEATASSVEQSTFPSWVTNTLYLAEKLKYLDPVYTTSSGEISEIGDPEWLGEFSSALLSLSSHQFSSQTEPQGYYPGEDPAHYHSQESAESYQDYSHLQHQQQQQQSEYAGPGYENYNGGYHGQTPEYQPEPPVPAVPAVPTYQEAEPVAEVVEQSVSPVPTVPTVSTPTFINPSEMSAPPPSGPPTFFNPTTMPSIAETVGTRKGSLSRQGSVQSRSRQGSESAEVGRDYYQNLATVSQAKSYPATPGLAPPSSAQPDPAPATKAAELKESSRQQPGGSKKSSWLGGIFSKIIKTDQVHLPDDKDKRIIYDEATGKWVNLDEDEDTAVAAAAPPPMMGGMPGGGPGSGPAPTSYRAGLAGRRGGRGYVNVLGQSGMTKPTGPTMMPNGGGGGGGGQPPLTPLDLPMVPSSTPMVPVNQPSDDSIQDNSGPASMPLMFNPGSLSGSSLPPPSF